MADISSITLPGGGTYDLKDKNAVPKYGMGKNLLRNWYWKNPANQRGQNSYTFSSSSYGIDAWKMNRGTITITSSGLVCTWNGSTTYQTNIQNIQNYGEIAGKTITMSALSSDGTLYKDTFTVVSSDSYVTSSGTVRFAASATSQALGVNVSSTTGITIVAVKAELGTEQTLCHNEGTAENPMWMLNEIPDYEYELHRCITSTADPSDTYANKSLATEQQLAEMETGTTASRNYAVGEYFCWDGLWYRVKQAISSGASFTVGTNCELSTVGNELYKVNNIYEIRVPANSSVTINTNNSDDAFVAIIIVRGAQASVYGAWLVNGYSILTGGRARVVQLDSPGNCSLSIGTTSRTIVISSSSSDTGTKAIVQVLSKHRISTT